MACADGLRVNRQRLAKEPLRLRIAALRLHHTRKVVETDGIVRMACADGLRVNRQRLAKEPLRLRITALRLHHTRKVVEPGRKFVTFSSMQGFCRITQSLMYRHRVVTPLQTPGHTRIGSHVFDIAAQVSRAFIVVKRIMPFHGIFGHNAPAIGRIRGQHNPTLFAFLQQGIHFLVFQIGKGFER